MWVSGVMDNDAVVFQIVGPYDSEDELHASMDEMGNDDYVPFLVVEPQHG